MLTSQQEEVKTWLALLLRVLVDDLESNSVAVVIPAESSSPSTIAAPSLAPITPDPPEVAEKLSVEQDPGLGDVPGRSIALVRIGAHKTHSFTNAYTNSLFDRTQTR